MHQRRESCRRVKCGSFPPIKKKSTPRNADGKKHYRSYQNLGQNPESDNRDFSFEVGSSPVICFHILLKMTCMDQFFNFVTKVGAFLHGVLEVLTVPTMLRPVSFPRGWFLLDRGEEI
ncbi:hypothetical protein V8G54_016949 [Vigna mungo]|uniref:Uncharacterized protein n=1 Tax=Vigna mungo TaxID=3915 RepID=A0AAQ3NL73_VIGMU